MAMKFCFERAIQLPRETVFAFHLKPACLALLHSGWSQLRVLKHESEVRVGGETWVEHTVAGCLPVALGYRHTRCDPPLRFAEVLIHGPFSRFTHVHEFEEHKGQTLVRDLLDVEWPWQFGGSLVLTRLVAPSIVRVFRNRGEALERLTRNGTIQRCAAEQILQSAG